MVLNIAHRGARSLAPENTLPAIRKAWEIGADVLEIDVAVTLDGRLILLHDNLLQRTTDVRRRFPGQGTKTLHDLYSCRNPLFRCRFMVCRNRSFRSDRSRKYLHGQSSSRSKALQFQPLKRSCSLCRKNPGGSISKLKRIPPPMTDLSDNGRCPPLY